tara:strand:+ start:156 stop:677 length:522 start_codon:yes stop_codon:yes gene_type:complete
MKNIVIILITLLSLSTDTLSQSLKPWKTRDGDIDMKSGFGFTICSNQTYSYNKKVNIKKCDTTKYIYEGKNVVPYRYFVDFKLREIVILSDCNRTYVGKYIIKKDKIYKIKHGNQKFYILCKIENKVVKIFKDGTGVIITTYDKKTKNTTISVDTNYGNFAKGDYINISKPHN